MRGAFLNSFMMAIALATVITMAASAQPRMTTVAKAIDSNPNKAPKDAADPRAYLNEIDGDKAMTWVKAHNVSTVSKLSKDQRYSEYQADILKILQATDRIASPGFAHGGMIDNFWQDGTHVQGLWRRTTWESYRSGKPQWRTILDVDALSKAEGTTWVFEGEDCLPPANNLCLISLSDGGKDADVVREFDVAKGEFVKEGFVLPEGKQSVTWVDENTMYVTREWTPGEVTASGYAYVTKVLKRSQSLDQAVEIFRGDKKHVSAARRVLRDIAGKYVMDTSYRALDFFNTEQGFYPNGRTDTHKVVLPLPTTATFSGYYKGQAIYQLKSDWTSAKGTVFHNGAIIAFDLKAALADPAHVEPLVLFMPDEHQSVEGTTQTKNRLVLSILSNVTSELRSFDFGKGGWSSFKLALPQNSTLSLTSSDDESDHLFVFSEGFLESSSLFCADAASGKVEMIKSTPERFDAEGLQVQQFWATSKDGTKVPYFLVAPKDLKLDGTNPTILYAYGGFEIPMQPSYSASLGMLWLEKGGAYALANIRGGGEFGPKWHEAGLKTHRQRVYDDFQAVAQDLIAKKLTSPPHLGIMGGSNGGLLMGVQLTERPDLWNAVVIRVPLLDMVNFTHMSAGASWQGEYGDPDDPVEGAFLRSISPYHNVRAGVAYPEPFFETSTKDDRVGPVHARKMAALFEDMGLPFYYYENVEGGHAAAANLQEHARRYALEYTYMSQKLMDNK
ncbi:prolyl oligopeptidase family serine peptidase (plasmid) [Sinorhizobium numidicum]|uniref:Prolyl oligopeptidase family serine peptidase n=1 Tax=Sinorhizobium numidicum TaxID=680248 RepID=A0ABY8D329_9HYPH|nr:prolyl oligopeptidase family serine peptidase [Sinorhizobium numidicum]WEX79338.1 prolyl oligopeptidase family serine peptidase [Sinorhizobium numidicum]WEX85291.1 prolyl oligopeptidase family serine peptidase [Sinorhizobium numidicum]